MATALKGSAPSSKFSFSGDARIAIVQAEWNANVTDLLTASAVETLKAYNLADEDIEVFKVPGAVELTFAASQLIEASRFDAVIVFGCVIRGDTPHFDYVCQSVTQGVTALNADCDIPVIFGVLTVENLAQALARAGGQVGDKGVEAAETALKMVEFMRQADK